MKDVLVLSRTFGFGTDKSQLLQLFEDHGLRPRFLPQEEAEPIIDRFEGIILGTNKFTKALFQKATHLKALCKYGVGTDNIDREAAEACGVEVLSLPGINRVAVAEMALGLIFCTARRIGEADRSLKSGQWGQFLGSQIYGQTLGLVGSGSIGLTLARMVSGLEMNVLAYDVYPNEAFTQMGGRYVSLDELLHESDFVSVHVPSTPETRHFIGAPELRKMKSNAILINTSRGAVVDEKALYEALKNGEIAGAGLDVYETEPPVEAEIVRLDNVVSTTHISAYSRQTLRKMDEEAVVKLSRALYGS